MPRFSIILPCFNAQDTILETIQSLVAQTCEDWEVLVVDDGSTDETAAIVMRTTYLDSRIRLIGHSGKGPSAARNAGAAMARGEILCFCDANDRWRSDKLARLAEVFEDEYIAGAFGRVAFFDGTRARAVSGRYRGFLSIDALLGANPVSTLSNMAIRRDAFEDSCGFDTALVQNEDLEWLIRVVGLGFRVIGVDDIMVDYRTGVTGLSSNLNALREGRRAALQTAARFGHVAAARDEAIYLRYLARRALRIGAPASEAIALAFAGCRISPRGWFSDLRRGFLTLCAVVAAPVMPTGLRRALFAS